MEGHASQLVPAPGPVPVLSIEDPEDPRLVDFVALTDVARRTSVEAEHGFFVGESELVVRRALLAGYPLRALLLGRERWHALQPLVAATVSAANATAGRATPPAVYVAPASVLRAVTGFHVHRGVLASFDRLPLPSPAQVLADARRVVVMEGLNNTTNLGAVFRSAAGLGMHGVLLDPLCCDPLYRRSVRVSMGEVFAVPYARLASWPAGLSEMTDMGFTVMALTPSGDVDLDDLPVGPADRVALVLGAEGPGLSAAALQHATLKVRIPMSGGVDSLNVGAAAAVTFWALRTAMRAQREA